MNKNEAQELTAQIRATAHGLWRLVAEAYDRKAWQALGYASWKDYATDELQMSESRSYQLVDTGRVMRAIGEVAGSEDVFQSVVVTARETARVKPHLSTFKKELTRAVKDGMSMEEAVEQVIENLPTAEKRAPRAPRAAGDVVIEGQIVEVKSQPEPEPIFTVPAPAARRPVAPAVAAPLFTAASTAVDQPVLPRGKKICTACDGHGYV